jgi:BirA family biotin operon repressor/biotin-[acetyl-CoA-carboxylase] ligase
MPHKSERTHVMATREKLLFSLKERKRQWVSGQSLTKELAVSRAAICKHIKRLREEGYDIASSTKKGYMLHSATDRLLPNEIREDLKSKLFGPGDIHYFEEIDSTNIRAKALAAQGASEGTLVVAETQRLGKGRRGRSWFSPDRSGIYLSLILRPVFPASEAPRITLMTAVAVADALMSLVDIPVAIKWPNDILADGKKLAGILTEMSTEMDSIDYVVVGLGLNVNTPHEDFPEELRGQATSLLAKTGERLSRVRVVRAFLEHFEKNYEQLTTEGFVPIMNRWRGLTNVFGQQVRVEAIGNVYSGKVVDVDSDGTLVLKDDDGQLHRVLCGDLCIVG